jgi:hypothetical protein
MADRHEQRSRAERITDDRERREMLQYLPECR